MKLMIATIITAVTLSMGTAQAQMTQEGACYFFGEMISMIGDLRDGGLSHRETKDSLAFIGVKPKVIDNVTGLLYETHGDKPVEEVQAIFLSNCLGETV